MAGMCSMPWDLRSTPPEEGVLGVPPVVPVVLSGECRSQSPLSEADEDEREHLSRMAVANAKKNMD